jgi:hypothetical protein
MAAVFKTTRPGSRAREVCSAPSALPKHPGTFAGFEGLP